MPVHPNAHLFLDGRGVAEGDGDGEGLAARGEQAAADHDFTCLNHASRQSVTHELD